MNSNKNLLNNLLIFITTIFICIAAFSVNGQAAGQSFHARLSPMPVTPQTVDSITGIGQVDIKLDGNTLTLSGTFSGMSSNASSAHIHNGPKAQPGPVTFSLEVDLSTGGNISGTFELTQEQTNALRDEEFYIQIHSEDNPAGELRGWILN